MDAKFTTVRPATFKLAFYCTNAAGVVHAIETLDGPRADYIVAVEGGADLTAGNEGRTDGWGEVRLTVRAASQHEAERAARKILERIDV